MVKEEEGTCSRQDDEKKKYDMDCGVSSKCRSTVASFKIGM